MAEQSVVDNPEAQVDASSVFLDYETMFGQFKDRIQQGAIIIEPADKEYDADGGYLHLDSDTSTKSMNPALRVRLHQWKEGLEERTHYLTQDQVADSSMPDELKEETLGALAEKDVDSVFGVAFYQNREGPWWMSLPGKPEIEPWLKDAKLVDFSELHVGDTRTIGISFFTDKVDPEEVSRGISEVAAMLAGQGLNLGDVIRWVNVVDEETCDQLKVPPHILDKYPKAYKAAVARKAAGEIKLNAKLFDKVNFEQANEAEMRFSHAKRWEETFIHEIAHLYSLGLDDMSSPSHAINMGWRRRDAIMTDDYGDMTELRKSGSWFDTNTYITDDYGNEVLVSAAKAPTQLITGGKDEAGNPIQPPTRYAAESSSEDIAESFASYIAGDPLDSLRRTVIESLIAQNKTLDPGEVPNITFTRVAPSDVDVWQYLPNHIRYKPSMIIL